MIAGVALTVALLHHQSTNKPPEVSTPQAQDMGPSQEDPKLVEPSAEKAAPTKAVLLVVGHDNDGQETGHIASNAIRIERKITHPQSENEGAREWRPGPSVAAFLATGVMATLQVGMVKTNAGLVLDVDRRGKSIPMIRVVKSLSKNFQTALIQQRKFNVVARRDLAELINEQDLSTSGGGMIDPDTGVESGKVKGAEYSVVVEIDHFLDQTQTTTFADGTTGYRRRMQLAGVLTVNNSATSETLDATDLSVELKEPRSSDMQVRSDGEESDQLLSDVGTEFAKRAALRTVDVVFPIKVITREEKTVTINRGDSSGLQVGDELEVYGPTKLLKDPDGGRTLKIRGAKVGVVRITDIDTEACQAVVVKEKEAGKSLVAGCVLSRTNVRALSGG